MILIRSLATSLGGGLPRRGGRLHEDDHYAAHQEPRIFWKLQRHSAPELTRLMLRLYAFPVHSASVERLWSELGGVLTKTLDRTAEKAFRIVKVRSQLRCKRKAKLPAAGAALRLQRPARSTPQPNSAAAQASAAAQDAAVHEAAEDAGLNLITGKPYPCAVLLCSMLSSLLFLRCASLRSLRCAAQLHVHAKPD